LQDAVRAAAKNCPTLAAKRVTPHVLRHYLPFRTMSCRGAQVPYFGANARGGSDIV